MGQKRISNITIAIFLIAGLLGFAAFQVYYDEAFPEASVDLKITREDAVQKSRDFFDDMGFDLSGYRHVVVFNQSQGDINFLERNLGLAEANKILRKTAIVYYWSVRWFKELEEVEYRYFITPDGRFNAFRRRFPEKEAGPRLSRERALEIAETFIREHSGLVFEKLEYIEHKDYERPDRLDHSFTWRLKDFDIGESQYRYSVTIQGNQVGRFSQWLRTPESWDRERDELWEHRGNLAEAFDILSTLLFTALLLYLIWLAYKRDIRWKVSLALSVLAGVVAALADVNDLPLAYMGYSTTESFSSFWIEQVAWTLLAGIGMASGMFVVFAASEGSGRHYLPDRKYCSGVFRRSFLGSSDFKRQMILGYGMAFAAVGYVTLFYVLGSRYGGVWVPVDVPISNTFSTYFPSMQAIYIGFSAAMDEELLYRLFAVAVLLRLTKRPWIAILLPAIAWGFAHTAYPQEPIWIRGVELSIAGIVYGWVSYRYGLVTTLTSHFVYNCFVGVVLQFQSGNPALVLNALAALSTPIIFVASLPVVDWTKKHLAHFFKRKTKPAIPVAKPACQPDVVTDTALIIRPLSWRLFAVILMISVSVYLMGRLIPKIDFYGKPPAIQMTQQEAYEKCLEYLREAGIDPDGYTSFTTYRDRSTGLPKYAFDQLGIKETYEQFADRFAYQPCWYTRWFREKTIQTYKVAVYDDGRLRYLDIDPADDDPGLTPESRSYLEESQAEAIAKDFLRSQDIDLDNQWERIEVDKITKPNRHDWRFTYRDKNFSLGKLESRRSIKVAGDRVSDFRSPWYKTPDEWERNRSLKREHLRNTIRSELEFGLFACLFIFLFIQFFILLGRRTIRKQEFMWAIAGAGILGLLMISIEQINEIPKFFYGYFSQTEQSIKSYTFGELVEIPAMFIGVIFAFFVFLLVVQTFIRAWGPKDCSLKSLLSPLHPRRWGEAVNTQGVFIGIALFILTLGTKSIEKAAYGYLFPGNFSPKAITASMEFYQFSESLDLFDNISLVFIFLLTIPVIILPIQKYLKKDCLIIPAILIYVMLSKGTNSLSTQHMLLSWVFNGLDLICIYLILTRILKWNVMAYAVYFWIDTNYSIGIGRFLTSQSEFFWVDIQRVAWLILPVMLVLAVSLWQRFTKSDGEFPSQ